MLAIIAAAIIVGSLAVLMFGLVGLMVMSANKKS